MICRFVGVLISSVARSESEVVQATTGVLIPVVLLSGVLWPIEALPAVLHGVARVLPTTWYVPVCV